ncbi:MAG: class I SAM-dependent methyltransferase family protein [Rhodovibrionaceae bacterium]|nr:class I SAM-dependent methyltransferase family protein [Rhodovibrionaceae bacterium]
MTDLVLDELKKPLPSWHPKAWYYAAMRHLIRWMHPLSKGLSIGVEHGFDSGVMLDHVYENRAEGRGPLGRMIDRVFLDAPGWVGIRNRGQLVQAAACDAIREAHARVASGEGRPVVFYDLACGGGRYAVGALAEVRDLPVSAVLRDYREENVARAKANARHAGVSPVCERADAFSDEDLGRLPAADVVVVSGLHEIVDDDTTVRRHFDQIVRLLRPGGVLIQTIQPTHPQLEFIARVLTSHTGRPWAMRLRPESLTRGWMEAAGFEIRSVTMEEKGIFGVVIAERRS